MDSLFSDPALLKTGGWAAAAFMFAVWIRSEQSHRKQLAQQSRNLQAFEKFATEAIRNADANYQKRRQQDQLLAEALEQVRADGERRFDQIRRLVAAALARRAKAGDR